LLGELLAERKREREHVKRQLRQAITLGILARYLWTAIKWLLVIIAAGVFMIFYVFFKVIFTGNTGR